MTLRQDPALRYSSVAQLSEDLDRYLDGLPVVARGYSTAYIATRFVQRNKALTATAALVVVTLIGGMITTRRAQARAERRFHEVQTLAHAMVFDYSDSIRGLAGATEVEKKLVTDAMTYLDGLARDAADDIPLRRDLLSSYTKMSEVQGDPFHPNLGETAAALATVQKALTIGERLIKDDQAPETRMTLATAYKTAANVVSSTGDLQGVADYSLRAAALYETLSAQNPSDVRLLLSLSETYWGLGDMFGGPGMHNLGKSRQGLAYYERALATARAAEKLQSSPDASTRLRVFGSIDTLGAMELALGHADLASRYGLDALQLIRTLVAEQLNNAVKRSALSMALDHVGRQLLAAGRVDDALSAYREGETMARAAVAADLKNFSNKRRLGIILGYLSVVQRKHGDGAAAVASAQESLDLMQTLSTADPSNADFRTDVATGYRRLAEAQVDAGQPDAALRAAADALSRYESSPTRTNTFLTLGMARALLVRGSAELALKQSAASVQSLQRAHDLLAPLHQRDADSAVIQTELARSASRLAAALKANGQTIPAESVLAEARGLWADLRQKGTLLPQDAAEAQNNSF